MEHLIFFTVMASVASSSKTPPPHDSTPEPVLPTKPKTKKKSKKDKGKDGHGKNEGTSANGAYQPPPNAIQLDHESVDYGEFDWDAVESNENCELWLLRIPDSVSHSRHCHRSSPNLLAGIADQTQIS